MIYEAHNMLACVIQLYLASHLTVYAKCKCHTVKYQLYMPVHVFIEQDDFITSSKYLHTSAADISLLIDLLF